MAADAHASELFNAIEKDDQATVKRLIEEKGVNPKTVTNADKQTAAHVAAQLGNLRLLTYLLKKDRSLLDVPDKWAQTVLHVTARKGQLAIFRYLVEEVYVDLNLDRNCLKGNTALHLAAEEGQLSIIKFYCEEYSPRGNPDLRNEEGETLVMSAAKKARLSVVEFLCEDGFADPVLVNYNNANILFYSAAIGDLTVPKYILQEIAVTLDPDWRDCYGKTVVFVAASSNHLDFIKYFVEKRNATIDVADNKGWTPLHVAASKGYLGVVEYLVEKKADVQKKENEGKKPVELAKDEEVIEYLRSVESRHRRSVPEQLFLQRSLHAQTSPIPCQWIRKVITDQLRSRTLRIEHNGVAEITASNTSSMDSFLMLAGACTRYVRGVRYERAKYQFLLSPKQIVHDRVDPIAFDAIDTMSDFDQPIVNNS